MVDTQNTNLSQSDMELLFGRTRSQFRGMQQVRLAPPAMNETLVQKQSPCGSNLHKVDIETLTTFVEITGEPEETLQAVVEFLRSQQQTNFKLMLDTATVLGYYFQEAQWVQYQLQICECEDRVLLNATRLEGFAPLFSQLWNGLVSNLGEQCFTWEQIDDDEPLNLDFLMDSDEEDSDFSMEDMSFLDLQDDPSVVESLIDDISDPNFQVESGMCLAWNCEKSENLEHITGDHAQQLFNSVMVSLVQTAADFCLPMHRCASQLVAKLIEQNAVEVSEEQYETLVSIMVQWAISNGQSNQVTESEEIATILSQQLPRFPVISNRISDALEQVRCQTEFAPVRENVDRCLSQMVC